MENLSKETFIEKVAELNESSISSNWNYKSERPCVIDFYADWCGPCKQLTPILKQISQEDLNVDIYKVNVDDSHELSVAFGIKSIPTLLFCNKEGFETVVGLSNYNTIKERIKKL